MSHPWITRRSFHRPPDRIAVVVSRQRTTYLAFLALAQGQGLPAEVAGVSHEVLLAIGLGAVFMGANTCIGNVPNFMVRSIAKSRGVAMPSFGGYLLYSGAVLLPVFLLVTMVFFG